MVKKTRATKANVGGAAMPAESELRKELPGISDADLADIRGGYIYNNLMIK